MAEFRAADWRGYDASLSELDHVGFGQGYFRRDDRRIAQPPDGELLGIAVHSRYRVQPGDIEAFAVAGATKVRADAIIAGKR
jgi:hypothetical protein